MKAEPESPAVLFSKTKPHRFFDLDTGAHFEFGSVCEKLEKVKSDRFYKEKKTINKNGILRKLSKSKEHPLRIDILTGDNLQSQRRQQELKENLVLNPLDTNIQRIQNAIERKRQSAVNKKLSIISKSGVNASR